MSLSDSSEDLKHEIADTQAELLELNDRAISSEFFSAWQVLTEIRT
jgi:hypothetical protein